jgi:N-acetyl-anhydromuramyl-L-alanine amidase AmpD
MTEEFVEKERISNSERNQCALYYPLASTQCPKLPTQGKYAKGYPEGAIVHFTSGRSLNGDQNALDVVSFAKVSGYCFFVISSTGRVFQGFPLNEWGYHAGKSEWKQYGKPISPNLVGIEVCSAGKLSKTADGKLVSWFGERYSSEQVRQNSKHENVAEGFYHKFTQAQEDALLDLLVWLKWNNESVFNLDLVLGHDEVSPGRKSDPGGSLSMTMPNYRKWLKDKYLYFSSIMP